MSARRHDSTRDELLDHEADGIHEFDNALPRWWLHGFYFTIAFAVVYMVNYHVLSTPVFGKAGMAAEYQAELRDAPTAAPAPRPAGAANAVAVALKDDASLTRGRTIFEGPDHACASCHRPDLGGLIGPNLTDDAWLHGCALPDIVTSIKTGYPMKGMMPFGSNKPLTDEQLLQVASYVLSRQGSAPAAAKPIDQERDVPCRRGD